MSGTVPFQARLHGFTAYGLRDEAVAIVVLPELGAKVISLRSAATGREWMWHSHGELRLFRNRPGDPFEQSTLAGADECLPTVAPCTVAGRAMPDHGEAWASPWEIDAAEFGKGVVCTSLRLPMSPLRLERRISLDGGHAVFEYALNNLADTAQPYLWAFHPLLPLEPDSRIELPASIRTVVATAVAGAFAADAGATLQWPEPAPGVRLDAAGLGGDGYAKLFADFTGCEDGWAAVRRGTERLVFSFSPCEIPSVGIWFTRREWNGHTHLALEPTSAAADTAAEVEVSETSKIPPHGERRWSFRLGIELSG